MTMEQDLRQVSRLAGEAADMAAAGQSSAMRLLLAEMTALATLLPGLAVGAAGPRQAVAEEERRRVEAEVEAAFDNMPV